MTTFSVAVAFWLSSGVFLPPHVDGSVAAAVDFAGSEEISKSCGRPALDPFVTLNVTSPCATPLVETLKANSLGCAAVTVTVAAAAWFEWASAFAATAAATPAAAASDKRERRFIEVLLVDRRSGTVMAAPNGLRKCRRGTLVRRGATDGSRARRRELPSRLRRCRRTS